jgi:leucyl aminopeptidase
MSKTSLSLVSQISPDQSFVCISRNGKTAGTVTLGAKEKKYAENQFNAGEDYVFINSYEKCIYLVRLKESSDLYKVREELRRTAYKMRKLIRSNNHKELVITSEGAYDDAVLDFAEGLLLSTYSFRKYKTKEDDCSKQSYPSRLLLHGNIDEKSLKWLDELSNAVYFTRDLINEPVNHLNALALAEEIKKTADGAGFTTEVLN